jgi:alkylation response protein AidB-like acyl-CoA dehydrogenase
VARKRPLTPSLVDLVGALETELAAAKFALADMLAASATSPGPETTNRIFLGRSNLVRALTATAERALELAQGSGYMRTGPIERLFRDIQAARFHPLQPHAQRELAGRLALGISLNKPLS